MTKCPVMNVTLLPLPPRALSTTRRTLITISGIGTRSASTTEQRFPTWRFWARQATRITRYAQMDLFSVADRPLSGGEGDENSPLLSSLGGEA